MTKITKEIQSKPPELGVLNNWLEFSMESAKKKHWEWFVIDQFLRGNHDIKGNPNDNSIVVNKKTSESINFPINKMFSTFRAVRAFVTRHKPFVEVSVEKSTPESIQYARRANAILERDNQLNNFRKISKEWVYYGIKYGLGYRQIGYDKEKKCAIRWTVDPFDLLVGSKYGEFEEAPYIIKTIVRTIAYWRNKYPKDVEGKPTDDLAPDNELAASEYKDLSLQILYQNAGSYPGTRMEEQTKIGYECWYKVYEPNSVGGTINKVCFVSERILSFEETPFNDYPFIPYKADIVPNETYSEGHMKHIIAPQRMLNLLNTQALEYNHIVNRGRILKDKNAGFRVINTREGQIIEKRPGAAVQVLNPPSINPMLNTQINMSIEYIEDIGGQHQASMGATPARVSSGNAIEALQLGDSNNISDLRDNFEDALELEAAWILKVYSLFEKDGFVMSQTTNKQQDTFAVVGNAAYQKTGASLPGRYWDDESGDYCDVCTVLADNQVKISITSQLGETKSAKLDMLFRLMDYGLPLNVVLGLLEFPNASDITQRIAEEALAGVQMEALKAQMAPQPGQNAPGQVPSAQTPGGQGSLAPETAPPPPPSGGSDMIEAQLAGLNQQAGALM